MIQLADEQKAIQATGPEQAELGKLSKKLAEVAVANRKRAMLLGPDGEQLVLPEPLFRIIRQAVTLLSQGARVVVAPIDKQISTQEAADLLNVSRPFLVSLIEKGELACDKTGRYRRLRYGDVVAYKEHRNATRRAALAAMMRKNREAGVYDTPDEEISDTR